MADPKLQLSYVVEQLRKHKLAYIHVVEPMPAEVNAVRNSDFLRDIWQGVEGSPFISTNEHTRNSTIETVNNQGGLVGFWRSYMPNVSHLFPDFVVTDIFTLPSLIFHSACQRTSRFFFFLFFGNAIFVH